MLRSLGLAVILTLSAGVASAAERSNTPPKGLDWSGVWQHITGIRLNSFGAASERKPEPIPLKPEFDKRRQEVIRSALEGNPIEDRGANCKWPGVPAIIRTTMPQNSSCSLDG